MQKSAKYLHPEIWPRSRTANRSFRFNPHWIFVPIVSKTSSNGEKTILIREYLSTELSPSPNCAIYPRGNSTRIPLIRWSRSRVSIGIVHRWFISMLGARHLRHRIVVSLLSSPPAGVVTRLPIFTVTQSQWILFLTFGQMSCETRRDKASSFFKRCILVRARCVTSLSIISYVYKCTYEDDDDGRIHTRRESKLAFVSRFFFFFFLPIAPIEESVGRRSTDCSSNGDNREGMRSATVSFCEKVW